MSGKPENPSAFPLPGVYDPTREQVYAVAAFGVDAGMTMRDYFAAAALQGLLSDHVTVKAAGACRIIAGSAYEYADAMLKARQS